ncbi:alpha/beta hydrolase [uncultured Campylobacter sp.]|uniref:RBBP9/YdeN family alpha/beta hydrolase n=1 Tax=uncultured Campylobacter sp. TaxID=218934 RepID=UPI002616CBF3|nr:alpha/beta hydrolase [uncultured Campylobacter sp.]
MRKISFLLAIFCALNFVFVVNLSAKESKELYIIHGFGSDSSSHWFKWLKNELLKKDKDLNVKILDLPNPFKPNPDEWQKRLKQQIASVNENTYFVAHSLGCIALLEYLSSLNEDAKVGGVLLVGGFSKPLSILPELNPFLKRDVEFTKLTKMIKNIIVLSAKNDNVVPTELSKDLAHSLNAKFIQPDDGKHFGARKPLRKAPIILDIVSKQLDLQ